MKIAAIGAWHVHTMEYATAIQNNPLSQLCCLWDDDPVRGQETAGKLGVPFQPSLLAIWEDKSIEAVQITTATSQHVQVITAAARAGKHIFTEKVLAFTNEDAQAIAAAVRESGVTFPISYPHKTRPALKAAKQLADSGKLGKITYARVHNAHNGSIADWLPPHFYDAAQTGGGAMMDLGAHPMYTLSWFMGRPRSVVSMFTQVTGRGVEDNAVSVLEFADGAIGVSETGFVTTNMPYVLELSGTKGSALIQNDKLEYSCEETGNKLVQMEDLPEASPLPIDAWIASLAGQGEAPNGLEDALALTELMAGAYQSYHSGSRYYF